MTIRRTVLLAAAFGLTLAVLGISGQTRPVRSQAPLPNDFTNFEGHPVHPICISPNGQRLFVLNVPDARLAVFAINGDALELLDEIPVGLEPVAVAARSDNEVWVVNHLSDDISIVDVAAGNVVRTLHVGDEPTDVVFARTSTAPNAPELAFVCVSQEDRIKVFDPALLAPVGAPIPVFGVDPRALALSPDRTRVYAAAFESGNRTTIIPFDDVIGGGGPPAPNPAMRADLPPAPNVGLIVRHDGTHWVDEIGRNWDAAAPYTVADKDVFVIDAASRTVTREITGVGTMLFNLAAHPITGLVWVTNTDALNHIRFEPNLRGQFTRTRVTIADPTNGAVVPVHLNPHINYATSPGSPSEIAQSLAQVSDIRFLPDGSKAYVAALGSNRIGVLDGTSASVVGRVSVGQGPAGLAINAAGTLLYVLNRFDNSISIVDTQGGVVLSTLPISFDPTPAVIKTGRPFLYDASLTSGHGDVSCASCHLFGNFDNIAWDLGDPQGNFQTRPPGMIDPALEGFHPMKGPMHTQSLRGLPGTFRLHWRADRSDFNAFNPAFFGLLGRGDSLATAQMQAFTDFINTVRYPPNPNQNLDRTMPNPGIGPSAFRGQNEYMNVPHDGPYTCNNCHLVPTGTNGQVINDAALLEDQDMKVPQMRNLYEKTNLSRAPGSVNKGGFGFTHDGAFDNLVNFLRLPVFNFSGGDAQRRDVEAFLFAFDTGTDPSVGRRITLFAANRDLPGTTALLDSLYGQAEVENCDLVVLGKTGGVRRGFLYDRATDSFLSDRAGEALRSKAVLRALAGDGSELTWFGVPPGSGLRMALDRDRDTYRDRDELDAGSNPADPNSTPANVAVDPGTDGATGRLVLAGGAPNPVGALGTTIRFEMPRAAEASLEVYDAIGRRVAKVYVGRLPAGPGSLLWTGRDDSGREVGAGLYFYRLNALGQKVTAKGMKL